VGGASTKGVACLHIIRIIAPRLLHATMAQLYCSYVILVLQLLIVLTIADYEEDYADGLAAYFKDDWSTAIEKFEKALQSYQTDKEARESCYVKCQDIPLHIPNDYADDEQYKFFHATLETSWCINRCKSGKHKPIIGGSSHVITEYMKLGHIYGYLQHAYSKRGQLSKASSYAATHLYLSPHDITSRSNIEFYRGKEELNDEDFKSLEHKLYRDLYEEGQSFYYAKEYERMVEAFEKSLLAFYDEVEKCRNECVGPIEYSGNHEFSAAMWKVNLAYLECKTDCPKKLGEFRDTDMHNVNFVGSFFHYLTYGYFYLNNMTEAAKAVTTHKRIEPNNRVVEMNRAYIIQQPGVNIKSFIERKDAQPLLDRMDDELQIINLVKGYQLSPRNEHEEDDEKLLEKDVENYPVEVIETEEEQLNKETNVTQDTTTSKEEKPIVIERPSDHRNIERVVMDNVLSMEQCEDLLKLAENCKEGDGYQKKSPHTKSEIFAGLTVLDAAKAVVRKELDHHQVQLYLNVSKTSKDLVAEQFQLTKPLLFSYTHLVCRTARGTINQNERANDLSHPVHADNCYQESPNGDCIKKEPAYTWRDYSAILYLNDDFEGGKFFFAHSPHDTTPEHYVAPKCGRLVGFSAGAENMHGVTAVTKGKRCAVALWFTFDPNYQEKSFDNAQILLSSVS
jgi:leucine proline-enriched proteoglycan (leprecan)